VNTVVIGKAAQSAAAILHKAILLVRVALLFSATDQTSILGLPSRQAISGMIDCRQNENCRKDS
jgi:hypothetical protein